MKTVIVTGGAQGIGRAIAEHFIEAGHQVVIADIAQNGQDVATAIGATFIKTDVRIEADVRACMQKTYEQFGTIDILINNAGKVVFIDPLELTIEQFDDVLDTNLHSVFLCTKEAVHYMKATGGSVVNLASTRAFMSEPHTESYAASKGGIIALTHAFARSLAPYNITVNSISPGWIETTDYEGLRDIDHAQHLSNRVGKPADIARACLFLTDPANNFITGENMTIDGGMTKKMIYEP